METWQNVGFSEDPQRLNGYELGLVLSVMPKLEGWAREHGLEPSMVKLTFDFQDSNHSVSFTPPMHQK